MSVTRAIIIGISNYSQEKDCLPCARPSAELLAKTLRENYKFDDVELVPERNTTLAGLSNTLSSLRSLKSGDAVLIAFCGHAKLMGNVWYLVPADTSMQDTEHRSFISDYELLREYVDKSPASHVLLVVDACYSGLLVKFRGVVNDAVNPDEAVLGELMSPDHPSRFAISSGDATQPVPDAGGAGVSLFMEEFCNYLRSSPERILPATTLGNEVRKRVLARVAAAEIKQFPQANHIAGDLRGVFCFVKQGTLPPPANMNRTGSQQEKAPQIICDVRSNAVTLVRANGNEGVSRCMDGPWLSKLPIIYEVAKQIEVIENRLSQCDFVSDENARMCRQLLLELGRGQFETYLKLPPFSLAVNNEAIKSIVDTRPEGAIAHVLFVAEKLLGLAHKKTYAKSYKES